MTYFNLSFTFQGEEFPNGECVGLLGETGIVAPLGHGAETSIDFAVRGDSEMYPSPNPIDGLLWIWQCANAKTTRMRL